MEPKILVIRLSSIGDIIQSSGVPRLLKKKFPKGEVHWLVRSDNAQLVSSNPHLNKIHTLSRQEGLFGLFRMINNLRAENFTHVYDAHNNLRSRIICLFLRPQHFIRRYKSRLKRFLLFNFKINLFEKPYIPVNSFIKPLEAWDVPNDGLGSEYSVPQETLEFVKSKLPVGNRLGRIAIAPSTAWQKKTWPVEHWKALVEMLVRTTSFQVIILAGPTDTFCRELVVHPERVTSFQGKLTLLECAAMLTQCRTLIAGDTGLLHLAEALQMDVIGLLGPTPFGDPHRKNSIVLRKNLWCLPCSKDGSGICINTKFQRCMIEITPNEVFNSLQKMVLLNNG